jgi:hypothetical protein
VQKKKAWSLDAGPASGCHYWLATPRYGSILAKLPRKIVSLYSSVDLRFFGFGYVLTRYVVEKESQTYKEVVGTGV